MGVRRRGATGAVFPPGKSSFLPPPPWKLFALSCKKVCGRPCTNVLTCNCDLSDKFDFTDQSLIFWAFRILFTFIAARTFSRFLSVLTVRFFSPVLRVVFVDFLFVNFFVIISVGYYVGFLTNDHDVRDTVIAKAFVTSFEVLRLLYE
jgi:hypothetical protein